jgi:putative copper export protein
MMPRQIAYALITFLHDLFTAAWIGGLITPALAVMPALRTTSFPR